MPVRIRGLQPYGTLLINGGSRVANFRCITTYYFYFLSTGFVKYFRTEMQGVTQSGNADWQPSGPFCRD
jgi:hypothetical protein